MSTIADTPIPYRPLGHVVNVVETLGLDVTYSYEDLVFVEHNAFLLRMGEKSKAVFLYFNTESTVSERKPLTDKLIAAGKQQGLHIRLAGLYSMSQKENEQTEIIFKTI
ncbi:MAG: hypothetical protein GX640_06430 [Fibrobacter sp.]|nr:hypothetical protein [Fibrobacter sp.]